MRVGLPGSATCRSASRRSLPRAGSAARFFAPRSSLDHLAKRTQRRAYPDPYPARGGVNNPMIVPSTLRTYAAVCPHGISRGGLTAAAPASTARA